MTAVMSRMYIPVSDITFLTNLPYPGISVMKHYHKMFTITVLAYRAVNYSGVLNIGIYYSLWCFSEMFFSNRLWFIGVTNVRARNYFQSIIIQSVSQIIILQRTTKKKISQFHKITPVFPKW